ncbi:elongation factor P [Enterococcus faecalis 13-SD-W-01]|nr:elongation factor P [Enterococcus faecalis 13-SD-W-01]
MIPAEELKKGAMIEFAGEIWRVTAFSYIEPSKGSAYAETQLKNIRTGESKDAHFQKGENITEAKMEKELVQYLYKNDDNYVFMQLDTYEQIEIPAALIQEEILYFPESSEIVLLKNNEGFLGLELPLEVPLAVLSVDADPSVSDGSKSAVLETGLTVNVPFFINQGDKIMIDTSDGSYVSRV